MRRAWIMSYDEDPLDLFEDDDDGVIETILLFDGEEEPLSQKTGCVVLILAVGTSAGFCSWTLIHWIV
jgi:hypothetical protein